MKRDYFDVSENFNKLDQKYTYCVLRFWYEFNDDIYTITRTELYYRGLERGYTTIYETIDLAEALRRGWKPNDKQLTKMYKYGVTCFADWNDRTAKYHSVFKSITETAIKLFNRNHNLEEK